MIHIYIDLVGLGGTGSALAIPLTRLLKYHSLVTLKEVVLYDADKVNDSSNLERQSFTSLDVGKSKGHVMLMQLVKIIREVDFKNTYLNYDKYTKVLENRPTGSLTFTIACVDNNATRNHLLKAIKDSNVNCIFISPGNDLTTGQVLTWAKLEGIEYGTYPLDLFPDLAKPKDHIPRVKGCQEETVSTPQLLTTNLFGANCVLLNIQNILDNSYFYEQLWYDIYKGKLVSERLIKLND